MKESGIKPRTVLLALVASLAFVLATPVPAKAPANPGECKIHGKYLDLNVLFAYPETDFTGWMDVFNQASEILHNSTEGNLQLGRVKFFVGCLPAKDRADIIVLPGVGGASSPPGGCGLPGWHITLYADRHRHNKAGTRGQIGIVHELGHYLFELRDEYGGCVRDRTVIEPPVGRYQWRNPEVEIGGGKAFFCTEEGSSAACLMDAGTTVVASHAKTEWCSSETHVGARVLEATVAQTYQGTFSIENNEECETGQDCWQSVAKVLNIEAPSVPSPHCTFETRSGAVRNGQPGGPIRPVLGQVERDDDGFPPGPGKDRGPALRAKARSYPGRSFGIPMPGDEIGVIAFEGRG